MKVFFVLSILVSLSFGKLNLDSVYQYFENSQFQESVEYIQNGIKGNYFSDIGEKSLVLLTEAQIRSRQLDSAMVSVQNYLILYPQGKYQSRTLINKAKIFLEQGQFFQSAQELFDVVETTGNNYSYQQAKELLKYVFKNKVLEIDEIRKLAERFPIDNELVGIMFYEIAVNCIQEHKLKSARYYLKKLIFELPDHFLQQKAREKLVQIERKGDGIPSVILAAPFSGDYLDLGRELLQGALLALDKFNKAEVRLGYRLLDTQSKPVIAVDKLKKILQEDNIIGVIGPVMSSTAASMATFLSTEYPNIPLVTPTATDEGIANLGSNIFQLNIPNSYLASSIGQFATQCQKKKQFLIFAPESDYGFEMLRHFRKVIEENGGEVYDYQIYEEGETDFRSYFHNVKLKALRLKEKKWAINKGRDPMFTDEEKIKRESEWLKDSTVSIDGFFIAAGDPQDAVNIAKQTSFFKINTKIFGSSGWANRIVLTKGGKYTNQVYFSAASLDRTKSKLWMQFKTAYVERWAQYPNRNKVAGLSFDAVRYFLSRVKGRDFSDRVKHLQSVSNFKSIYGDIKMDPESGSNVTKNIMVTKNSRFFSAKICKEF